MVANREKGTVGSFLHRRYHFGKRLRRCSRLDLKNTMTILADMRRFTKYPITKLVSQQSFHHDECQHTLLRAGRDGEVTMVVGLLTTATESVLAASDPRLGATFGDLLRILL